MDTTKREDILRRIKALREKTTANGCTEAEALAAMGKMEALMHEYNVSHAELGDIDRAQFGAMRAKAGIVSDTRVTWHPAVNLCWHNICEMCGCESYRDTADGVVVVFGERGDCEAAVYLIDLVRTVSEDSWRKFWDKNSKHGGHAHTERSSFLHGFGVRVALEAQKIQRERNKDNKKEAQDSSMALMLVKKDAIVEARYGTYLKQKGVRISYRRSANRTSRSTNAYGAGDSAGKKLSLGGRGKSLSGGAKQIAQ